MKTLVIIPAYNEELNICNTVENLINTCPNYDYVIVNDGSSDRTVEICRNNKYNLISLPVNLGLSGAFQTGMKYAWENNYDCAIQFDADGQHLPEYIQLFVNEIKNGSDIVVGSRFLENKKNYSMRMVGSRLISWAILICSGERITDPTSGMRMYSRRMIREFACNLNYGPEPDTISFLSKNGANISEVSVAMNERMLGSSYLNSFRAAKYMVEMLISIIIIQNFRKRG